ncbi:hypothetical protein WJX84_006502 [Apatococcus fuscideae]|uniref:AB hydrolase-1 domain-containing protein n=1 Tax=Apatococcus fuscideae TaxID=2026836 RepID=A0AAW1SNS3_9CHLO
MSMDMSSDASFLSLPDGRRLCYHLRGCPDSLHQIFYLHGVLSCRLEVLGTSQEVLQEVKARLIGVDRPGYGQSDPHPKRTAHSFSRDLLCLANHLSLDNFFVIGCSGGGPYAWAALHHLGPRVLGLLTLSGAGPASMLTGEERLRLHEGHEQGGLPEFTRKMVHGLLASQTALWWVHTLVGASLVYRFLEHVMANVLDKMAPVDAACIREQHPEYHPQIVAQALAQRPAAAAAFLEDLDIGMTSWPWDISQLAPEQTRNVHLWHGHGDKQVPPVFSEAYHRLVPSSKLHLIDSGGHFAFYMGSQATQRQALSQLIAGAAQSAI